jgi:DNA-directed RNA polymerase beta subunit
MQLIMVEFVPLTPEGKNGLVNSITIYANLNQNGFETPFWKMYKGIVLNTTDPLLFDSKQEGDFTIAPGDIKKTQLIISYQKCSYPIT